MNQCFEYLNFLPEIPNNLLESIEKIDSNAISPYPNNSNKKGSYLTTSASTELCNFIKIYFPKNCFIYYQVIKNGIPRHIDIRRKVAFNYLLEPGGTNVFTNFYDRQHNLIQQVNILPNRWHKINTSIFHDVTGIEKSRISLSVEIPDLNYTDSIF